MKDGMLMGAVKEKSWMEKEESLVMWYWIMCLVFFFFQAEDGIRDYKVTGVQTCALPIWTFFLW